MRPSGNRIRTGGIIVALALFVTLFVPLLAQAAPPPAAATIDGLAIAADGVVTLAADAPAALRSNGRFGILVSTPQEYAAVFDTLRVDYRARIPSEATVALDVRASADGMRWTQWEVDIPPGATARFDQPARFAQYRLRMQSSGASPALQTLRLTPLRAATSFAALEDAPAEAEQPIAPTFTVHATRQGMVGGRTANGHRITKRDRFVSLPCWCALSSKGGSEYMVRITYNGRSAVAPVYDVGPWNTRDNYWDPQEKRTFSDLRQGWPQDHAAFFDGHNNGRALYGRVRFPTAIDVGDGIWWDDLQIKGDRAVVEVTFLWMGRDPLEPPPAPPAIEPPPATEPPPAPAP